MIEDEKDDGTIVLDHGVLEKQFGKSLLSKLEAKARSLKIVSDIKKKVSYTLMTSDDYQVAFENCMKLGLKKAQEREIVKVLVQCSMQEKVFNKYYVLLAQKLCEHNHAFIFSLKFTLWDYLKIMDGLSLRNILNLAKLYGTLINNLSIPLQLIKFIDFSDRVSKF